MAPHRGGARPCVRASGVAGEDHSRARALWPSDDLSQALAHRGDQPAGADPRGARTEREAVMANKKILCLDFDGVIHSYVSGWQGADVIPDPPVEGALDFLEEAHAAFQVYIYSARSHQIGGIQAMQVWLIQAYETRHTAKYDEPTDDIRDSIRQFVCDRLKWPTFKPSAFVTLDDRVIRFEGPKSWPAIPDLLAFQTWMQRDE